MNRHYNLAILGAGSTAFAAAHRAAELGKTVLMTENRTVGGTCANRGCLPSKNLIEAARIYWESKHPQYPGLTPGDVTLDFRALVQQKNALVHEYRIKKYESAVSQDGLISIARGTAALASPSSIVVDGQRVEADHLLIASGSRPVVPAIEGLDRVPYLTSDLLSADGPQELLDLPGSLVIVGGGYIALELGQMFQRFGTRVTVLEQSGRLLPRYEPEIGRAVEEVLRKEGVNLVLNAQVERVLEANSAAVIARIRGRARDFRADRLLVATGRVPNSDQIGLSAAGVETDRAHAIKVDEYLQTTVPTIWAAGDVIGQQADSQMATPVGAHDGVIAAENALAGARRVVDHRVIPRVIFTDPQVAVVGLTDEDAVAAGHRCRCSTVPMSLVPRAGAVRDTRGLIKMVIDSDTHKVLGVSMLAASAGEVIHEAAMALRFGATVRDFVDMVHVFPTIAEALKLVALSFEKDVTRLSCCAE
jgi:mercuric reductase